MTQTHCPCPVTNVMACNHCPSLLQYILNSTQELCPLPHGQLTCWLQNLNNWCKSEEQWLYVMVTGEEQWVYAMTLVIEKEQWVYVNVIHCLSLSILMTLVTRQKQWVCHDVGYRTETIGPQPSGFKLNKLSKWSLRKVIIAWKFRTQVLGYRLFCMPSLNCETLAVLKF